MIGTQYKSFFELNNYPGAFNGLLFRAIDSVAKSGISKKEVYLCFVVLIDAKTGNIIYSNGLSSERTELFYVSEKDLLKPDYINQIALLIDSTLPN